MASRSMPGRTKTFGVQEKCIRLKLFPNDTSTPTYSSTGGVASVARSAAGKFLITLEDAYLSCVDAQAHYVTDSDSKDLYAQVGAISNLGTSTATTIVVKLKTGSTNTDNGAATSSANFISCCLVFEDSSAATGAT